MECRSCKSRFVTIHTVLPSTDRRSILARAHLYILLLQTTLQFWIFTCTVIATHEQNFKSARSSSVIGSQDESMVSTAARIQNDLFKYLRDQTFVCILSREPFCLPTSRSLVEYCMVNSACSCYLYLLFLCVSCLLGCSLQTPFSTWRFLICQM